MAPRFLNLVATAASMAALIAVTIPDVGAAGLFVCIVALLLSLGAYLRWDRSPFSETPISINASGAVERPISRGDNERALRFVRQRDSIINALQGTVFNLGQELRMYARLQLMLGLGAAGLVVVACYMPFPRPALWT